MTLGFRKLAPSYVLALSIHIPVGNCVTKLCYRTVLQNCVTKLERSYLICNKRPALWALSNHMLKYRHYCEQDWERLSIRWDASSDSEREGRHERWGLQSVLFEHHYALTSRHLGHVPWGSEWTHTLCHLSTHSKFVYPSVHRSIVYHLKRAGHFEVLKAEGIQFEQARVHVTLFLALINQEVSVTLCLRSQPLPYSSLCVAAAAGRCYCHLCEGRFGLTSYKL